MKDSIEAFAIRSVIASLTNAAMGGDWEANEQPSVLQVMGRDPAKARDVPVAMEMVALLQHFADRLAVRDVPELGEIGSQDVELSPGIVWGGSKLLALLDIPAGAFEEMAIGLPTAFRAQRSGRCPVCLPCPSPSKTRAMEMMPRRCFSPTGLPCSIPMLVRSMLSRF